MSDSQITVEKSAETAGEMRVVVRESLTIPVARDAHAALVDAFSKGEQVRLDLEGVEEIDLSGLQLICAAHKSSRKLGKTLLVNGIRNAPIQQAAEKAGFVRMHSCAKEFDNCFWCVGEI